MRPVVRHGESLSEVVLSGGLSIKQYVGIRRDDFREVLYKLYLLIVVVVPILACVIPAVSEVVPLVDAPLMISHGEQVIHWLLPLGGGDMTRQVEVIHREVYVVVHLRVTPPGQELETLDADDEDRGELPDVDLLEGWLVLLALLAVPLVLPVEVLLLGVL